MLTLCSLLLAFAAPGAAAESADVKVMSFNIRYGTARDGANAWENRREFLVETIRAFGPDLLGTQETLGFQRDYLAENLPGYAALGVGRDDGAEKGEMMALYYRADRFEPLRSGHFWLSETPDEIGSKSWDSSLPRMATWVVLRDRKAPDAPPIAFINTHFDHIGREARLESARLIRAKAAEIGSGCRVVVTGDFNAGEGSPPYQALFDPSAGPAAPLLDAFRLANPDRSPEEGTFCNFRSDAVKGDRIDWIGLSPAWDVKSCSIDRTSKAGRTPSDHFPVTAVLGGK